MNGPGNNPHQPHYQVISQQDQVQIFQELVTTPAGAGAGAQCGRHADPLGELTTSFLSICGTLKDNRLLPAGFLPLDQRVQISRALGAGDDMAEDAGAVGTGDDPAYKTGGGDTFVYHVPLSGLQAAPAKVSATLYYQATPPFSCRIGSAPPKHGRRSAALSDQPVEAGRNAGGGLEAGHGQHGAVAVP